MRTFWLVAILVILLPVFFAGCGGSSQPTINSDSNAGLPTMPGDPKHAATGTQEEAKKLGRGPGSAQFQEGLDAARFGSGAGAGTGKAPGTPK